MLPSVVWAEESKNGLRFEIGPHYDAVPTRPQLVTRGQSSCMVKTSLSKNIYWTKLDHLTRDTSDQSNQTVPPKGMEHCCSNAETLEVADTVPCPTSEKYRVQYLYKPKVQAKQRNCLVPVDAIFV